MLTQLAEAALRSGGQVGLLFLDTINRHNPTPAFGQIEASSPCYAVPLLGHEACVLGAVNLGHMVRAQASGVAVDWQRLERTVRLGIRFLDDVLEVGRWPTSWVASMVRANRKVGLGVMGFADLLIELGIPYGSPQSVTLADSLMSAIAAEAQAASQQLGRERGVFPGHSHSVYARAELRLRNATRLAIAPAASISVIAGVAPGIEPLGALAHYGAAGLNGKGGTVPHPILVRHAERAGLSEARLREELAAGALTDSGSLPTALRELFRTAPQIHPHDHLAIQAAFQKHVDNAVAKQIYMPVTATPRDLAVLYRRAWELGCKGLQLRRAAYQGPPATGAAT
jgi:ribonucleoside-diphosphate reductase alpha chain